MQPIPLRRRHRRWPLAVVALAALLLSVPGAPARGAEGFRLVDLGTLGGNVSEAHDISDRGTVVGESQLASGATHAFLWRDGAMTDLGTLGGDNSVAYAVNDADQVVGVSDTASGGLHAFLWQQGGMRDLGSFGRHAVSTAVDVNGLGHVLVRFGPKAAPIVWRPDGHSSGIRIADGRVLATALNDRDQVVGRVDLAQAPPGGAQEQGFVWRRGHATLLGTLGGPSSTSIASAVNDRGQVVGWSEPAGSDRPHAFLWRDGVMTDLGTLDGTESFATGINVHTTVVGFIFRADLSRTRAFRWRNGAMTDLGVLDPASAADTKANAINQQGQIVGTSGAPVGMHAVLWQPL